MRPTLSTYSLAWSIGVPGHLPPKPLDIWGFLSRAKHLQVPCIQIADNLPLHKIAKDERKRFRAEAEKAGIAVEVGSRGLTEENLTHYIDIAVELGSPILRFVIDQGEYEPDLQAVTQLIQRFTNRLQAAGICLAIENHDRFPVADLREMVDRFPIETVGICLDTVNSLGCGEGWNEVVHTLVPATVNLHVKDFSIRRVSHQMGFIVEGVPFGGSKAPWQQLFKQIESHRNCTSAVLENWVPPGDSIEATVDTEDRWCRQGIQKLKSMLSETPTS